jgi:hypothetical protein
MTKDGKLKQHRIILGKQIEVDEDQLTFHVQRLVGSKIIQVVKLDEEPEPKKVETKKVKVAEEIPVVEETFVVEETPAVKVVETASEEAVTPKPKKGRGRKKQKSDDSI